MYKLSLLIALLFCGLSFGQDRMTPELLWKIKRVGSPALSPDGSKVVFSMRSYDLKSNSSDGDLYWVETTGGEIHKLTNLQGSEYNVQWSADSKSVYYIGSNGERNTVYKHTISEDFGVPMAEKFKGSGFKISEDETKILFIREVRISNPQGKAVHNDLPYSNALIIDDLMYRHWDSYEDGKRSHIFLATIENGKIQGRGTDIMDGEDFDAPMKPFGGMEQINFSPNGMKIVYTCKKKTGLDYAISTNSEIYVYDVLMNNTFVQSKSEGYDMNPVFSADGKKLAWLSMEQNGFEADKNDILVYDYKTQQTTNLTADIDITISDFVWDDAGEKIFFKSCIEATYQLFEIDLKSKKHRQITEGIHNYTSLAFANGVLVGGKQSMNHPTDIYAVNVKSGEETQLTDANKEIYDKIKTGEIEKRWVETTDGKKELVWVIYPPEFDKNKVYPALLYCQGGPQSAVSQFFSYRWNFQLMAANDYIIIAPNRRGLPGFGQEWNDDISGDWGGQPMDDYLSAVDEIKKEPFIDENRIGAVGASYGGYSVYYLAGIHENRFKCFISHCGLFNLESWYGTTEELFFANKDIGGPYFGQMVPKSYKEFSPHKLAHNWNTPMLIFHGEKDYRVPVNQGMEAFQVLQIKRIDSRMVLFPDENHWVLSPQNGVLWHREYYAWLDKHLK